MNASREVDAVLARFGFERTAEPGLAPASMLNRNYRVETSRGVYLVRIHRQKSDLARLELEAAAMAHCAERGIPVPPPLADLEGRRFVRKDGHFSSVTPWVDGRHVERGAVGVAGATLLGDMEGRVHAALRDFPAEALGSDVMGTRWDTGQSIQLLSRIDDVIRYYPAPGPERLAAQEVLRHQLGLLERDGEATTDSEFDWLGRQPAFGDYHDRNVIIDEPATTVLAVVDWEMVNLLPPLFELLRAVQYSGATEEETVAWVRAYGAHQRIPAAECRASVEMRYQATLHSTWAMRQVFIEGDGGPAEYFPAMHATLERWSDRAYRAWLADLLVEELAD